MPTEDVCSSKNLRVSKRESKRDNYRENDVELIIVCQTFYCVISVSVEFQIQFRIPLSNVVPQIRHSSRDSWGVFHVAGLTNSEPNPEL